MSDRDAAVVLVMLMVWVNGISCGVLIGLCLSEGCSLWDAVLFPFREARRLFVHRARRFAARMKGDDK